MKTEERLYNKIEELEKKYIETGEYIEKLKKSIKTTEALYDYKKTQLRTIEDASDYMHNIIDIYDWDGWHNCDYPKRFYIVQRNAFSKIKVFFIDDSGYVVESVYTIAEIETTVDHNGGHYEKVKEWNEITDAIAGYSEKLEQCKNKIEEYERDIDELNAALSEKEAEYSKIFEEGSKTLKELKEKFPEYYKTKYW